MNLGWNQGDFELQSKIEGEVSSVMRRNNLVSELAWRTEDDMREILEANKDDSLCLALKVKIKGNPDPDKVEEESNRGSPYMILHSTKLFKVKAEERIMK